MKNMETMTRSPIFVEQMIDGKMQRCFIVESALINDQVEIHTTETHLVNGGLYQTEIKTIYIDGNENICAIGKMRRETNYRVVRAIKTTNRGE